jgi:hypothetical protein
MHAGSCHCGQPGGRFHDEEGIFMQGDSAAFSFFMAGGFEKKQRHGVHETFLSMVIHQKAKPCAAGGSATLPDSTLINRRAFPARDSTKVLRRLGSAISHRVMRGMRWASFHLAQPTRAVFL